LDPPNHQIRSQYHWVVLKIRNLGPHHPHPSLQALPLLPQADFEVDHHFGSVIPFHGFELDYHQISSQELHSQKS
jgi:hypothetical protein